MDSETEQLLRDLRHRVLADAGPIHVFHAHPNEATWDKCNGAACVDARELVSRVDSALPMPEPVVGSVVLRKGLQQSVTVQPFVWQRREVVPTAAESWFCGASRLSWEALNLGAEVTVIWTPED